MNSASSSRPRTPTASASHCAVSSQATLGIQERKDEIDGMLTEHAQNWRVERMAVIDRLVLRLAVFEMLAETETPSKVIINEAIELARSFSGDAAVGFVNGVLELGFARPVDARDLRRNHRHVDRRNKRRRAAGYVDPDAFERLRLGRLLLGQHLQPRPRLGLQQPCHHPRDLGPDGR